VRRHKKYQDAAALGAQVQRYLAAFANTFRGVADKVKQYVLQLIGSLRMVASAGSLMAKLIRSRSDASMLFWTSIPDGDFDRIATFDHGHIQGLYHQETVRGLVKVLHSLVVNAHLLTK
jgi:hypothetical protein